MGEVISLNDWKRQHSIALPRSPYSTLRATDYEISSALQSAAEIMEDQGCYAAIVGYESKKTGEVKLLKNPPFFSDQQTFERMAEGIRGYYAVGLKRDR